MRKSHWSKIENSPRLQRVFTLMKDCICRSTRMIERGADVSAAGEAMTEIRRNFERNDLSAEYSGFTLPDSKQKRLQGTGALVATYQFVKVKIRARDTYHEEIIVKPAKRLLEALEKGEQSSFLKTSFGRAVAK